MVSCQEEMNGDGDKKHASQMRGETHVGMVRFERRVVLREARGSDDAMPTVFKDTPRRW